MCEASKGGLEATRGERGERREGADVAPYMLHQPLVCNEEGLRLNPMQLRRLRLPVLGLLYGLGLGLG
jgi:hypothetical protein